MQFEPGQLVKTFGSHDEWRNLRSIQPCLEPEKHQRRGGNGEKISKNDILFLVSVYEYHVTNDACGYVISPIHVGWVWFTFDGLSYGIISI